jgi:hypothetical protein
MDAVLRAGDTSLAAASWLARRRLVVWVLWRGARLCSALFGPLASAYTFDFVYWHVTRWPKRAMRTGAKFLLQLWTVVEAGFFLYYLHKWRTMSQIKFSTVSVRMVAEREKTLERFCSSIEDVFAERAIQVMEGKLQESELTPGKSRKRSVNFGGSRRETCRDPSRGTP